MRLSHCESHCAGPFRYVPCLPKSKDVSGGAASAAARPAAAIFAAAEEQPPQVQKIQVAVAEKDDDGGEKREDVVKAAATPAAAPTKSSLKKASSGDGKCVTKGNVQWVDLLGKDLTEVKEFEPRACLAWLHSTVEQLHSKTPLRSCSAVELELILEVFG